SLLALWNDVKTRLRESPGWASRRVAEALTSRILRPHALTSRSRCTRFKRRASGCDRSFGDGTARSVGGERAAAARHARVCRYLASRARHRIRLRSSWQALCVRFRRRARRSRGGHRLVITGQPPPRYHWGRTTMQQEVVWRNWQG